MVGKAWEKHLWACMLAQVPMIARRALAAVVRACLEWGQRQWSTVLGVIVGQCFLWWRPLVGRDS